MQIIALIVRAAATTVDFFATPEQALDEVKFLLGDYGLSLVESTDWTVEQVSAWIAQNDVEFEVTFEEVTAPAFRVTVTDLATEAAIFDRLLTTTDRDEAKAALGSAWNSYGFGKPGREAILWSVGSEEPVERITDD